MTLTQAVDRQQERLANCVHCGFCLPACPTYVRLGDEADSPRGRLYLMRAVVEGRLDPGADAFQDHIDRCLGCRACETVCPSGVEYGLLLEEAREEAVHAKGLPLSTRVLLAVFGRPWLLQVAMVGGRTLRASRLARALAQIFPERGAWGAARLGMAMLWATTPPAWPRGGSSTRGESSGGHPAAAAVSRHPEVPVALLTGCVQAGLYGRVNGATERVLEANGYRMVEAPGQVCCGALHAHAGDLEGARARARANIVAFESARADAVVVNAAGCGAAMKEYGALLADDPGYAERAASLASAVRDVSELLADRGPRSGGSLPLTVAYDPPCHLFHAQRVTESPLRVLAAIPGLELRSVEGAEECCGGAGIYGLTHPELGGRIGGDKVAAVAASGADALATGNPGCMMQIGAGLRLAGRPMLVCHPVELLDESYRRGNVYDAAPTLERSAPAEDRHDATKHEGAAGGGGSRAVDAGPSMPLRDRDGS